MKRWEPLTAALCAAALLCGFSVPSYTHVDGGAGSDYGDPTIEAPAPAPEPTAEPGQGFSEEGGSVARDLLYDGNTDKQFITVHTSGGATLYFVIDCDRPVDERGEQYGTYFLNVVDETNLLTVAEAAGVEQVVCSCSEKYEVGVVSTECVVYSVNMGRCVGAAPEPVETGEPAGEPETGGSMRMLLLILTVAGIDGGAAFYFKVFRPKQQQAAEPEEDYDEESYEDNGPPWGKDESSEGNEK